MSLVPSYVRSKDGYFYKDPILEDPRKEWFICFDDDDDPELVIAEKTGYSPEVILNKLGIKYENLREGVRAERVFGKGWKFKPARSYFFWLKSPLDPKFITEHEGRFKNHNGEGVYYDPET